LEDGGVGLDVPEHATTTKVTTMAAVARQCRAERCGHDPPIFRPVRRLAFLR
jgi:hypothetical protein